MPARKVKSVMSIYPSLPCCGILAIRGQARSGHSFAAVLEPHRLGVRIGSRSEALPTGHTLEYLLGKQATHPRQDGTLGGREVTTGRLEVRETEADSNGGLSRTPLLRPLPQDLP